MIPLLSRESMRAFDAHAIQQGIPGSVLMENAGRGAAERITARFAHAHHFAIVCGTGNNGGDGFVVARHLARHGARVSVFLAGDAAKISGDARAAFDGWVAAGGSVQPANDSLRSNLAASDVVIDAIFGTGLNRDVSGNLVGIIEAVNAARASRVSLDIPSGLDADTGAPLGIAVRANLTITFAFGKKGLFSPRGRAYAGEIEIVEIGVQPVLPESIHASAELIEASDVTRWIVPRSDEFNKYTAGHVAIFAGSPGKIGASLLVAQGAIRAGAGATTVVTWPEAATALEARVIEVMTARIDRNKIADSIDSALGKKKSVVIGPGFGLGPEAREALEHLLKSYEGPLVLDADALTLAADVPNHVAKSASKRVLLPHSGELSRILSCSSEEIDHDRYDAVARAAKLTSSVVVLKGAHSLVADPSGKIAVGPRGSPALATAGSGDVLAGIVGAMLTFLAPFEAACAGVFFHAHAGERWSKKNGDRGLLAREIAEQLPALLHEHTSLSELTHGHSLAKKNSTKTG
jgi:NAD(P)H-hydrate epimerase